MFSKRRFSIAAMITLAGLATAGPTGAATVFPAAGTDNTTSLGQFTIDLNPAA